MARVVTPEVPPVSEEKSSVNSEVVEKEGLVKEGILKAITTGEEKMLISSDEMSRLVNEWDADGKNDLYINPSLAERIRQYLAYQEELDPLKAELAERIYKPYLVTSINDKKSVSYRIFVNKRQVACVSHYLFEGYYKVIHISAYRNILFALKNPYAPFIDTSKDQYVDYLSYIISIGREYKLDESYDNNGVYITL